MFSFQTLRLSRIFLNNVCWLIDRVNALWWLQHPHSILQWSINQSRCSLPYLYSSAVVPQVYVFPEYQVLWYCQMSWEKYSCVCLGISMSYLSNELPIMYYLTEALLLLISDRAIYTFKIPLLHILQAVNLARPFSHFSQNLRFLHITTCWFILQMAKCIPNNMHFDATFYIQHTILLLLPSTHSNSLSIPEPESATTLLSLNLSWSWYTSYMLL